MSLADAANALGPLIGITFALIVFGGLAFIILKGYRLFNSAADRARRQAFVDVTISQTPASGLVAVVFHTYNGILHARIVEHRFWATPDDARLILARLNWFNFKWGFFAHGAVLIPLLSIGNYWTQLARIKKQAASGRGA